jgi:hypothetical protein
MIQTGLYEILMKTSQNALVALKISKNELPTM